MALKPTAPATSPKSTPSATSGGWGSVYTSCAVAVAFLAYYLVTSPAVSGDKDASEFTLVLATFGVTHPTGYPLYTIFGSLFVRLMHLVGWGAPYAANAWSAVGGAMAMGLLHRGTFLLFQQARMIYGGSYWLTLLPPLLVGLNPIYTVETNFAEVYSWHTAWVGLLLISFLGISNRLEQGTPLPNLRGMIMLAFLWGAVCGLGGAHHLTAIFFAAPLSIGVLVRVIQRGAFHWWLVLAVVLGTALPLCSYGFIVYRAYNPGQVQWMLLEPSLESVWRHITGAQYRMYLGKFAPSEIQKMFMNLYIYPFLGVGMVLWMMLLHRMGGTVRFTMGFLLAACVMQLGYNFNYGVPDPASYFLACIYVALPPAALMIACLLSGISRKPVRLTLVALLVLGLLPLMLWWNKLNVERRDHVIRWDAYIRGMWESIPDMEAMVFWPSDMIYRLMEYQILLGEKQNIQLINTNSLTHAFPREQFKKEHGFDPIEGLIGDVEPVYVSPSYLVGQEANKTLYVLAGIHHNINTRLAIPVIVFDPEKESVRMLRKPVELLPQPTTQSPAPSPAPPPVQ